MTLDEAIQHCEEVIKGNENLMAIHMMNACYDSVDMCNKCNEEHRQLAEWLKELKEYREIKKKMENNAKKLHFVNNQTIMDLREVTTDANSD